MNVTFDKELPTSKYPFLASYSGINNQIILLVVGEGKSGGHYNCVRLHPESSSGKIINDWKKDSLVVYTGSVTIKN